MARQFNRWTRHPDRRACASRTSWSASDYQRFPSFWDDPQLRKWNLWGYVDESHVAQACRRALEADVAGAEAFIIAAADTVMQRPSRELMAEVFPGVPVRDGVDGHDTLLGIDKARRVLGYAPGLHLEGALLMDQVRLGAHRPARLAHLPRDDELRQRLRPPVGARRGGRRADHPARGRGAASTSSTPPTSTPTAPARRSSAGRLLPKFVARDEVVIATKVHGRMTPGPERPRACRASTILAEIDASLRRLGTDYVDLYQIHRWDPHTPIEETMEALHDVVRAGKARYIGASSACTPGSSPRRSTSPSATAGRAFVSMQNHYNLLYREEEREMLPLCLDQGVGVIPWSPLARGLLTGTRTRDGERRTTRAETDAFERRALRPRRRTSTSSTASPRSRPSAALRRRRSRWPGCCTSPASPRRSSAPPSSSTSTTPSPPPT